MLKEGNIATANDSFERYKERLSNFSGEFELGLFLYITRKSILWVIIFLIISGVFAYVYLRYTPPVFESKSIIQMQTSNTAKKVLDVEGLSKEGDDGMAESVELLRSKVFCKRVLQKLPLEISYFAEGTFKTYELYKGAPYRVDVKIKNPKICDFIL